MSAAARPASGFAGMTDRLYRMPIGDFFRRRLEAITCEACGSPLPGGAIFCPSCGVRADDPQAEPLHIVDRTTGLFNERFVRPVLEDELARAHRYQRNLGVLLIEGADVGPADEMLKTMAAALAGTVRDVDTPGVLGRTPPQLLAILPDTDVAWRGEGGRASRKAGRTALRRCFLEPDAARTPNGGARWIPRSSGHRPASRVQLRRVRRLDQRGDQRFAARLGDLPRRMPRRRVAG